MEWTKLLSYITGTVDQELLRRNEYLITENRILRSKIDGRVPLTDPERITLARLGKELGRKILGEITSIVKPDTILRWHHRLIAKKFDGSAKRGPGRPRVMKETEELVVKLAHENRTWGYDRIAGALKHLGHKVSDTTIGNILERNGIEPAPERKTKTTWKEFIDAHKDVLAATDFFTVEVWTHAGLVTHFVLFFIHVASRRIKIAGITPNPTGEWMGQIARNETADSWGFLEGARYLIHDRDGKYCEHFRAILRDAGVKPLKLPTLSPNLNSFAERWVRTVKDECVSRLIFFGTESLRHALREFESHYLTERPHQSLGNELIEPATDIAETGAIERVQRLGGLLNYYRRRAA